MKYIRFIIAAFLMIVVFYNQYLHIAEWGEWIEILWYCNIATLIMAVGLILKSSKIASFILSLSIISQGLWIIDFFLQMSGSGLGRTAELFTYDIHIIIVSTILHGILIPVSFFAVRAWGFEKQGLWYGIGLITLLLPMTYFFTPIEENINCVFATCDTREPINFFTDSYLYWIVTFSVFHQFLYSIKDYISKIRQS